ncbi:hypothetical protein [Streptomyces prunicolor]|uniref:hypothetical protein n=1 Tax=Streptomyces prunicolor TaxID=67348 RepID=UPI00036FF0EB|nr:hypothetical protein [Streptomyces prunicolor]
MPKVKFSAFATDAKTGERGHGTGETTVSHWVSHHHYPEVISQDLECQGYKDVAVVDVTVKD